MEVDQTILSEEEIDYWCTEFSDLDRDEVIAILEIIDADEVKGEFWQQNPNLEEEVVNEVVKSNLRQSYEYHLYRTLNNEAQ
jgi:hypothetical protein